MALVSDYQEVRFDQYCAKCVHASKDENEDPCWDCLENPVNVYSRQPVYFKEKETKKK